MTKTFRDRFNQLFGVTTSPAPITETSSLHEISLQYPNVYEFMERKYGVKIDTEDKVLSLSRFVEKFGLPPAQILFMEVQMSRRIRAVRDVSALEAKQLVDRRPDTLILDVREAWEVKICRVPNSQPLTPELLDELLTSEERDVPILLYCHFGVRSLDAATFLADRGFTEIHVIHGGIEAWALDVDPSLPRYDAAYC